MEQFVIGILIVFIVYGIYRFNEDPKNEQKRKDALALFEFEQKQKELILQKELQKELFELEQKQKAYQDALYDLRQDPTNPALHEQALLLGRIYAAATRTNKAVTLFDETALANDIRAVTANATQTTKPVSALNSSAALAASLDERINTLLKLKASGLITDAEFDQKRKELLDSI